MEDHHTWQHLHANLADTDTEDYHLKQPCSRYVPKKINEIFKDLPNVFGIADEILVVGYEVNGKDPDEIL